MIERLTEWSADAVAQIIGAVQLFSPKYMLGALLGCVLNACSLLGRGIVRMIFPPRTTPQPPAIAAAEALLPRLLVQSSSSAGPNRWLLTAAIRWAPSLWSFARDARTLVDGGYSLARVVPVDQFVWSAHVELVGVFRRSSSVRRGK